MDARDTIALSLFASRVSAVCEQMGACLGRTAFSPNIRDRKDYSCALFTAEGDLLGQATHIPVHLGSMAFAMADLVAARRWAPDDMLILNDPYRGGTHLPDVTLVAPAFVDDRIVGFCANRAHHADIGADAPGSMPVTQRLEEEGVLIPPTLLLRRGRMEQETLEGLLSRLSDRRSAHGDFSAQVAANRLGVERLGTLAGGLGMDEFIRRAGALQDYAERLARAAFADIPDGRYSYVDYLDDDGAGHEDIPIAVTVTVDGSDVSVDFQGTADQVPGNLNCPLPVTAAAVFYVFRCLMPSQAPAAAGAMRPLELHAPSGSLVNAREPAAVTAGNVETSTRIVDAVCGALAEALPRRIPAASQGTMNNIAMGRRGSGAWDYYETLAGGHGAGPWGDGLSARHSHMTNTLNTPVEVIERHYPLRVQRYGIRHGSGGDGVGRGGDGVLREYRFLEDTELSLITERRRRRPWGLAGGMPGRSGENRLDGERLPGKCQRKVREGQTLVVETPGGGGYGIRRDEVERSDLTRSEARRSDRAGPPSPPE